MSVDSIGGVVVPSVVAPTSLDELCFELASAAADDQAICAAGSGSKLEIGAAPTRLDRLVSLAGLTEVIEYNPSDLVVRAQAGVPLATLQSLVAKSGQRLALDPPEVGATLGGVVAANASGPRRHRYGTVRDLLIGATFVLADGTVAHTGGKVVKNVAGYDLAKLLTGSYGTLAVLADVTFRLHGLPAASMAVSTSVASVADAVRVVGVYQASRLEPTAVELRVSLPSGAGSVIALFEGDAAPASTHAATAAQLVGDSTIGEWDPAYSDHPWSSGAVGLRIAFPPAALGAVLAACGSVLAASNVVGRTGIGVLEIAPADVTDLGASVSALRVAVAGLDASVVVVSAPVAAKVGVDLWGPVGGLALMRSIKGQFDPDCRLAPGRFIGGI
jgi:glycolate oxidase FAD binding subunit